MPKRDGGMEDKVRNKITNTLWGLFFIIIGVGFAGNVLDIWDFTLFFKGWWTLLIIIPCFISMIQSRFGAASTIGFIIGVLLLVSCWVKLDFSVWELIVPVLLIYIGLRLAFQGAFRKKNQFFEQNINIGPGAEGQPNPGAYKAEYSAVFSSNRVHVTDFFAGASLNAVFGAVVLDLRDAQLPANVEVNATAIFGGIDIYIPKGVNVKVNNVPIFGGVSNKTGQFTEPGAPTIYLNSTCMFGGIDIK